MVYVRLQDVDHDESLRDAGNAALDEAGWSPAEWRRSHRGKLALRRGVKDIGVKLRRANKAGQATAGDGAAAPLGLALPGARGGSTALGKQEAPPPVAVRRCTHHLRDALRDLGKPGHYGEVVSDRADGEVQHQITCGLSALAVPQGERTHKHVELILAMVRATGFAIKSHAQMQKLCRMAQHLRLQPRDAVFREGDIGSDIYIVIQGPSLSVRIGGKEVTQMRMGRFFGEFGLLTPKPTTSVELESAAAAEAARLEELEEELLTLQPRELGKRAEEIGISVEQLDDADGDAAIVALILGVHRSASTAASTSADTRTADVICRGSSEHDKTDLIRLSAEGLRAAHIDVKLMFGHAKSHYQDHKLADLKRFEMKLSAAMASDPPPPEAYASHREWLAREGQSATMAMVAELEALAQVELAAEAEVASGAESGTPAGTPTSNKRVKLLKQVDMLAGLAPYDLLQLSKAVIQVSYNKGDVLMRQGDTNCDAMWVMVEGVASVSILGRGVVYHKTEGEPVGETALLTDASRNATVVVASPTCQVLELSRAAFDKYVFGNTKQTREHLGKRMRRFESMDLIANEKGSSPKGRQQADWGAMSSSPIGAAPRRSKNDPGGGYAKDQCHLEDILQRWTTPLITRASARARLREFDAALLDVVEALKMQPRHNTALAMRPKLYAHTLIQREKAAADRELIVRSLLVSMRPVSRSVSKTDVKEPAAWLSIIPAAVDDLAVEQRMERSAKLRSKLEGEVRNRRLWEAEKLRLKLEAAEAAAKKKKKPAGKKEPEKKKKKKKEKKKSSDASAKDLGPAALELRKRQIVLSSLQECDSAAVRREQRLARRYTMDMLAEGDLRWQAPRHDGPPLVVPGGISKRCVKLAPEALAVAASLGTQPSDVQPELADEFRRSCETVAHDRPYAQFWRNVKHSSAVLSPWAMINEDSVIFAHKTPGPVSLSAIESHPKVQLMEMGFDPQEAIEAALASPGSVPATAEDSDLEGGEPQPSHWDYIMGRVHDILVDERDACATRRRVLRMIEVLMHVYEYYTRLAPDAAEPPIGPRRLDDWNEGLRVQALPPVIHPSRLTKQEALGCLWYDTELPAAHSRVSIRTYWSQDSMANMSASIAERTANMTEAPPIPRGTPGWGSDEDVGEDKEDLWSIRREGGAEPEPTLADGSSSEEISSDEEIEEKEDHEDEAKEELPPIDGALFEPRPSKELKLFTECPWPPKGPKPMILNVTRKVITKIYEEKIQTDEVDDSQNLIRQSFPSFIYGQFFDKYGVKALAEKKLGEFINGVRQCAGEDNVVKVFGSLSGMLDARSYSASSCNFILDVLGEVIANHETIDEQLNDASKKGSDIIAVNVILKAVKNCHEHRGLTMPQELKAELQERAHKSNEQSQRHLTDTLGTANQQLREVITRLLGDGGDDFAMMDGSSKDVTTVLNLLKRTNIRKVDMKKAEEALSGKTLPLDPEAIELLRSLRPIGPVSILHIDDCLDVVLASWLRKMHEGDAALEVTFTAFDKNKDGELSQEEFSSIIHVCEKRLGRRRTDKEINRMYREAVEESGMGTGKVTVSGFMSVAKYYNLGVPIVSAATRQAVLKRASALRGLENEGAGFGPLAQAEAEQAQAEADEAAAVEAEAASQQAAEEAEAAAVDAAAAEAAEEEAAEQAEAEALHAAGGGPELPYDRPDAVISLGQLRELALDCDAIGARLSAAALGRICRQACRRPPPADSVNSTTTMRQAAAAKDADPFDIHHTETEMHAYEFVESVLRMSCTVYGGITSSTVAGATDVRPCADCFEEFMLKNILPHSGAHDTTAPLRWVILEPKCRAVVDKFKPGLEQVFCAMQAIRSPQGNFVDTVHRDVLKTAASPLRFTDEPVSMSPSVSIVEGAGEKTLARSNLGRSRRSILQKDRTASLIVDKEVEVPVTDATIGLNQLLLFNLQLADANDLNDMEHFDPAMLVALWKDVTHLKTGLTSRVSAQNEGAEMTMSEWCELVCLLALKVGNDPMSPRGTRQRSAYDTIQRFFLRELFALSSVVLDVTQDKLAETQQQRERLESKTHRVAMAGLLGGIAAQIAAEAGDEDDEDAEPGIRTKIGGVPRKLSTAREISEEERLEATRQSLASAG